MKQIDRPKFIEIIKVLIEVKYERYKEVWGRSSIRQIGQFSDMHKPALKAFLTFLVRLRKKKII